MTLENHFSSLFLKLSKPQADTTPTREDVLGNKVMKIFDKSSYLTSETTISPKGKILVSREFSYTETENGKELNSFRISFYDSEGQIMNEATIPVTRPPIGVTSPF